MKEEMKNKVANIWIILNEHWLYKTKISCKELNDNKGTKVSDRFCVVPEEGKTG